jgi:hypothetical protein
MKGGIFNARKESTCQKGPGQKASREEASRQEGCSREEGGSCEEARQEKISGYPLSAAATAAALTE